MALRYLPAEILKKVAPAKRIENAVKSNLTLKKVALIQSSLFEDVIDKKAVEEVALRTMKSYRARAEDDPDLKEELADDPAQLVQRVQNEVVFQVSNALKERYHGQTATWLPSDADEPRPEHQLNYGKTYEIGVGIDGVEPGDEYGCKCGFEIDVDDSSFDL